MSPQAPHSASRSQHAALSRLGAWPWDSALAGAALVGMLLIPLVEIGARPWLGHGISNAPVLVQHLGLVLAMFGAIAAQRTGHVARLGRSGLKPRTDRWRQAFSLLADLCAASVCGVLAWGGWQWVQSEREVGQTLAYGLPVWWIQAVIPVGFAWLGLRLGTHGLPQHLPWGLRVVIALAWTGIGATLAPGLAHGLPLPFWGALGVLAGMLLAGAPIFAVLGGLAVVLFAEEGQPLAAVLLSHYQITVNPSLPALPLFTLAGLIFARTAAAQRLGQVFTAVFGTGVRGTVTASAVMCSCFTAITGGSGVTILALGGLLLPLLRSAGYPERQGIGLVTSASALGVLLAPSVPLIMYAIIARVPINTMFLAGVVPAVVMVVCLLLIGGFLRTPRPGTAHNQTDTPASPTLPVQRLSVRQALWQAKWELGAPVVAVGSLVSGWATPTESAALTAAYAIVSQAWLHRELSWRALGDTLAHSTHIIGGVMLILGMALGLTNYLIDAGIPDAALAWAQHALPNRYVFLLALNVFLFVAGALMEIFAALVVLVPLLLPVATAYGVDPVHFGIIFLANMEMGFLCPPAGMNLYFASAMFERPMRDIAAAVWPAVLAILVGTLLLSWLPILALGLPRLWLPG